MRAPSARLRPHEARQPSRQYWHLCLKCAGSALEQYVQAHASCDGAPSQVLRGSGDGFLIKKRVVEIEKHGFGDALARGSYGYSTLPGSDRHPGLKSAADGVVKRGCKKGARAARSAMHVVRRSCAPRHRPHFVVRRPCQVAAALLSTRRVACRHSGMFRTTRHGPPSAGERRAAAPRDAPRCPAGRL